MEEHKEPRYILGLDFRDAHESLFYGHQIEEIGYAIVGQPGNWAKVFSGSLAAFLRSDEVEVNIDTRSTKYNWSFSTADDGSITQTKTGEVTTGEIKEGTICGRDYLTSYLTGYVDGKMWFEKNYGLSNDTMYNQGEKYVGDLHDLYFHSNWVTWASGLVGCKKDFNFIITHQDIKEKGRRSGIIASIEELVEKHPRLFGGWDICQGEPSNAKGDNSELKEIKTRQGSRGQYNNLRKDTAINYFYYLLENDITKDLRKKKEPNAKVIIEAAYNKLREKKNESGERMYPERTLGGYLPAAKRVEMFGEIRQRVLEQLKHIIR